MNHDPTDTWGEWVHHAKEHHLATLLDGRVVELRAVHRPTRSCKVRLFTRNYFCWVEQIALVCDTTTVVATTVWRELEPWKIVDLSTLHRQPDIRSSRWTPSQKWLETTP